jgi:hypothetical protein
MANKILIPHPSSLIPAQPPPIVLDPQRSGDRRRLARILAQIA